MEWLWSPVGIGVVWLVLHSADYLLTVAAVRLLARGDLRERVQVGGSLELNPLFQQVVEQGRWLSGRFLLTLVLGAAVLPASVAYFHWVSEQVHEGLGSLIAEGVCGGLVVTRFAVIAIHLQNIRLFLRLLNVPEASGVRVRYDRGTVMMVTRARKLEVAALSALAALMGGGAFFVGGVFAMLALVAATFVWERRQVPLSAKAEPRKE
jgi:hypothetical protein